MSYQNLPEILNKCLRDALLDRIHLSQAGMSWRKVEEKLSGAEYTEFLAELCAAAGEDGRYNSKDVIEVLMDHTGIFTELSDEPPEGWLEHCRLELREELFPHLTGASDPDRYKSGRYLLLRILRGIYEFERAVLPFDPTRDMHLLSDPEIKQNGWIREYIRMHRFIRTKYVYEFMRISAEITPFNTLGHIGGVHYVAMYIARQLAKAGVPVDLGLVSGSSAAHDIGKYGCRPEEERRVPYLHYYYTDYCLTRYGLPTITHIAANHSTWDLELENLSAESLILIYSDFRVKSTRSDEGEELIHFYTLGEAFDVILNKLDNVDEAKRQRYVRVYNKLKDFENYMIDRGVVTELPADFAEAPAEADPLSPDEALRERYAREIAFMNGSCVTENVKYAAVDHNIRLMSMFNNPEEFGSLIEAARSETQWKNIRTYIGILGAYSAYMTQDQKTITLDFLYTMLPHRESDIREQAANIMGRIVGKYREEYKKELPASVPAPDVSRTNLETFREYLGLIISPSRSYTDVHRKLIESNTDFFVKNVLESCREDRRYMYLDIFAEYLDPDRCTEHRITVICSTLLSIDPEAANKEFRKKLNAFINAVYGKFGRSSDLILLYTIEKYFAGDGVISEKEIRARRNELIGVKSGGYNVADLSPMYLDDLKFNTPWIVKVANIDYMLETLEHTGDGRDVLQTAMHFANLIKVSETVTVRRRASDALLSLLPGLRNEQRNELIHELLNGLELGDYQFSKFIPDVLGAIMVKMPAVEFDEIVFDLEKLLSSGSDKAAASALNTIAVAAERYREFASAAGGAGATESNDSDDAARLRHLEGLLLKGAACYDGNISQEALRVMGERIFSSTYMTQEEKGEFAAHTFKRLLMLLPEAGADRGLEFYNNAAFLNMVYRFVTAYECDRGGLDYEIPEKVAFFPGTFDPFSRGHKEIATTIRDMGCEVYLAIDEFSWSKKTLPHMLRRNILQMSIADEEHLNIFPDDISINIANPTDLAVLREIFQGRKLYIAAGSDVVLNASAYRKEPEENSIHTFNHILFARASQQQDLAGKAYPINAEVVNLTLEKYYEDISSTRIRENIDKGRDISALLDPIAQNYIYENNLYSREPTYKHVLQARMLNISNYGDHDRTFLESAVAELKSRGYDTDFLGDHVETEGVRSIYITSDHEMENTIAFAFARRLQTRELLGEFGSGEIASVIRNAANGDIALISAFYTGGGSGVSNLAQILLTELVSALVAKDYAYAVYHPVCAAGMDERTIDALTAQGFINISQDEADPVYAVDMKKPIVLFRDVETVIKAPLNKNARVLRAIDEAHYRLTSLFNELYPGQLIISYNTSAVYSKIVDLVAKENGTPIADDPQKRRGPYMSVPFGKALSDVVVPNTVTKAMRTEKYFNNNVQGFDVREMQHYAPLGDQARTIESFDRPVILIDDLLHSGQRLKHLDTVFAGMDIEIRKVIVGVLTGRGLDMMEERGRAVQGAYFLPTISMWLNERDCYPFIGGDSIEPADKSAYYLPSINLIMPYTSFSFVGGTDQERTYRYSMTCLENALDIFRVLEREYQTTFGKKLTLKRLGDVFTNPRRPMLGDGISYDETVSPSVYIENDIRQADRLNLFRG